jgi:transposase
MNFNREDVRKLIYYCWKRGLATSQIEKEINSTLGIGTISLRTCADWVAKFKNGDFDVDDQLRSGRTAFGLDLQIQQVLENNRHATVREIGAELDVSHETVRQNLLKMGKQYLCNAWVPHTLSEAAKAKRSEICHDLLQMYQQNHFLHQLITADESWIYWETSPSYHHKSWRGPGDEPATEALSTLSNEKHLLTIFWGGKGVIFMDVLPCGRTITAEYYCNLLDQLKVAVFVKRRRQMSDGGLYL